jgi:AcrR family transcriptional regulator
MLMLVPLKAGKNDDARERSKSALLRAGADLLVEHAQVKGPFAALRLRTICARADYSTGAFYLHWSTLDEYYEALGNYLAAADEEAFTDDLASLAELGTSDAEASVLDTVVSAADRNLELLMDSKLWDAMQLLSLTWGRTRFRDQMARGYDRFDYATGQAYGSLLASRGREPRPPLDWNQIGAVLQSLIEGFGMRRKIDPSAVTQSSETALGPYPAAAAALLAVLTRPIGDVGTLDQALRALFVEGDLRVRRPHHRLLGGHA